MTRDLDFFANQRLFEVYHSMSIVQLPKVRELADIASAHAAIHHPYLQALARGDLPNPRAALVDFAIQYQGYTSWFPKYLHCVLAKLPCERHRGYFAENLAEEQGYLDEETLQQLEALRIPASWVQGIPHSVLFRRFQESLGVRAGMYQVCPAALEWRQDFHSMLQCCSAAEAIGAVGLGTESIVKHIYRYLTTAIQNHTDLDRKDYVFFELHSEVDEEHAELMLRVADDLAEQSSGNVELVHRGMMKALDLRRTFWEAMYARAGGL